MPSNETEDNDDVEIRVGMLDMGSATAPNTPARRKRRALQITASRLWVVQHELTPAPCQLCPRSERLVTYTSILASYLTEREGVRICYVCLGSLSLVRENGQKEAEKRLYGVKPKARQAAARTRVGSSTKRLNNKPTT